MNARHTSAYKKLDVQTSVSEASPLELLLMVYQRTIDNLVQAQIAMDDGKDAKELLSKAIELIEKGLLAALDDDKGGDIAANLRGLYAWSLRQILMTQLKRDPMLLSPVLTVMRDLQSAWTEILQNRSTVAKFIGAEVAEHVPVARKA
jgi:flagellar protein FliS